MVVMVAAKGSVPVKESSGEGSIGLLAGLRATASEEAAAEDGHRNEVPLVDVGLW